MKEKFVDILYSSLEDVLEKGLDKKFIKLTINSIELSLRQQYARNSMTGFVYGEVIMGSWLYDRDPNLKETYNIFYGVINYLKDFDMNVINHFRFHFALVRKP